MQCNVGGIDRVLRLVLGVAIVGAGLGLGNWLGLIGVIPLLTGLTGRCPTYLLFGFTTCDDDKGS
jgi:hypothetical protein